MYITRDIASASQKKVLEEAQAEEYVSYIHNTWLRENSYSYSVGWRWSCVLWGKDPFLEGIAPSPTNHQPSVAATNEHCIDCHRIDADLPHQHHHIIHFSLLILGFLKISWWSPFAFSSCFSSLSSSSPPPSPSGSKVLAMLVAA